MTRMGLWQNVDPLREAEERPRGSRFGTLVLTSLGGACIVFAVISQSRRNAPPARRSNDALGDLLAQSKSASPPAVPAELFRDEVTFPSLLSDEAKTTTALVAVRPTGQATAGDETSAKQPASPPPPTDRLPVIPLPARNLVSSSSLIDHPRDALSRLARQASAPTPLAAPGRPGGYQLQASSFRSESEAASFVMALRQRGHHAYTEVAQAPGRGTWYRARIGPFPTKRDAMTYRAAFEEREHLVPFVLDPQ